METEIDALMLRARDVLYIGFQGALNHRDSSSNLYNYVVLVLILTLLYLVDGHGDV